MWSYGRRITGGYRVKIGSLCTGYGGLDMAVEASSMQKQSGRANLTNTRVKS